MAPRTRRKSKHPKGWPTKDGRPATVAEIQAWCLYVEAAFNRPRVPTGPHFCQGCTQPLEHEPCHVCAKVRLEKVSLYRKMLDEREGCPACGWHDCAMGCLT